MIRDIFIVIPLDDSIQIKKYAELREYIDKIIIDKKFTARYINNSGT